MASGDAEWWLDPYPPPAPWIVPCRTLRPRAAWRGVRGPAVVGLFGKSGPQGLPRAPLPRDIQLRLSQRGTTGVGSLSFACSSPDPGGTERPS